MSFGSKRLDEAFDRWITQTPEEYFGVDEDDDPIANTLKNLIELYTENIDALITFGKYEGSFIHEVPEEYIEWAKEELSKEQEFLQ
jgi:hypothetical protein